MSFFFTHDGKTYEKSTETGDGEARVMLREVEPQREDAESLEPEDVE